MNCFGVYHSNEPLSGMGDLACIAKGRMQLCAAENASEGRLIAIAEGRLRNRYALLNQLRLRESPSNALIVLSEMGQRVRSASRGADRRVRHG